MENGRIIALSNSVVGLEFFLEDGDQDIGKEAANLGCIRELLSIACGRTFRVGCAMAGAKESA